MALHSNGATEMSGARDLMHTQTSPFPGMGEVDFQPRLAPRAWGERLRQHQSFLTVTFVFVIVVAVVLARVNIEVLDALPSQAADNFSPRDQDLIDAAALVEVSRGPGLAARISRPIQVHPVYIARPERGGSATTLNRAQSRTGPEVMRQYTVRPGDTVWGLSQQLGLKAETILWTNPRIDESTSHLSVGDELTIPPMDGALHIVGSGDTLSEISLLYEVRLDDILGFAPNNLKNNLIFPSQRLFIPGGIRPPPPEESFITYTADHVPGTFIGSGTFQRPVTDTYVSQGYWAHHRAIDYAGPTGSLIRAVDHGVVAYANFGWNHGYGNMVVIDHGNGFTSLYAHLSTFSVRKGAGVRQGQIVGNMGNSGNSTGPHLHLEIRKDGKSLNPSRFLD